MVPKGLTGHTTGFFDNFGDPDVSKARVAQEWMSWTLPARCQTTAAQLQASARLMSPALKANAEDAAPAEPPVEPAPADKPQG